MARRSNKSISEIVKPTTQSATSGVSTRLPDSLPSIRHGNIDDTMLERKITLVTEDFATNKYCEAVLKDRNRLSKENALTIYEYLIAMKRKLTQGSATRKILYSFCQSYQELLA